MEGTYIATLRVMKGHPIKWEEIKERLAYHVGQELFPKMIDSGDYHVCKFDMIKRDYQSQWDVGCTEYAILSHLSIAHQQTVVMPRMEELTVEYMGEKYTRVCKYCGNALILDQRGGCSACGSPNGGYK